jgi:hypothetical protein
MNSINNNKTLSCGIATTLAMLISSPGTAAESEWAFQLPPPLLMGNGY